MIHELQNISCSLLRRSISELSLLAVKVNAHKAEYMALWGHLVGGRRGPNTQASRMAMEEEAGRDVVDQVCMLS